MFLFHYTSQMHKRMWQPFSTTSKFSRWCVCIVWDSLLYFALFFSFIPEWKSFYQTDRKDIPFCMGKRELIWLLHCWPHYVSAGLKDYPCIKSMDLGHCWLRRSSYLPNQWVYTMLLGQKAYSSVLQQHIEENQLQVGLYSS